MGSETGILGSRYVISANVIRELRGGSFPPDALRRIDGKAYIFDRKGLDALRKLRLKPGVMTEIERTLSGRRYSSERRLLSDLKKLKQRPRTHFEREIDHEESSPHREERRVWIGGRSSKRSHRHRGFFGGPPLRRPARSGESRVEVDARQLPGAVRQPVHRANPAQHGVLCGSDPSSVQYGFRPSPGHAHLLSSGGTVQILPGDLADSTNQSLRHLCSGLEVVHLRCRADERHSRRRRNRGGELADGISMDLHCPDSTALWAPAWD